MVGGAPACDIGKRRCASASILVSGISAAFLLASTLDTDHGLWQRLGLTVADSWIVVIATAIVGARWLHDENVPW